MGFFTELSNRWNQDGPKFFKKLQSIGVYLISTAISLVAIPAAIEQFIPSVDMDLSALVQVAGYVFVAGSVLAAVAKLPVKDADYSELSKKQEPKNPE